MEADEIKLASVELTRDQLYELVWQTPMSRLAARYGISGNGLAKICEGLKVLFPPRGHWAKKAAGQEQSRQAISRRRMNHMLADDA